MPTPEHVVVLMMENRSFDHMLGFMPGVGDLTGQEFNPVDPQDPTSPKFFVTQDATNVMRIDPGHGFQSVGEQLFGGSSSPIPLMNGFRS